MIIHNSKLNAKNEAGRYLSGYESCNNGQTIEIEQEAQATAINLNFEMIYICGQYKLEKARSWLKEVLVCGLMNKSS